MAPKAEVTTYARALHRACLIAGGIHRLADQLKVGEGELRHWMLGRSEPPHEVFLAAVEMILLYSEQGGTPA